MTVPDNKVIAALYIKGTELVPEDITAILGVSPTTSQARRQARLTSAGSTFVAKIGLWALVIERDNAGISTVMADLFEILGEHPTLANLTNVEEAYFDVFVATLSDDDGDGACEFQLSAIQTAALAKYGLPVRFTVTMGNDK